MKFRPLHDRVLVRRAEPETKTAGGIIIPESAEEKPSEGVIVAVGSGYVNDNGEVRALDVKKGDKVIFSKWAGTEIKIDGEELMVMKESDIIGVVDAA
ncbi:MAG: co-chaperone GroES [Alphaproteobacteria bacterium]|nr:co-chaperone GroES [Alphaproteobacteria bacterium]